MVADGENAVFKSFRLQYREWPLGQIGSRMTVSSSLNTSMGLGWFLMQTCYKQPFQSKHRPDVFVLYTICVNALSAVSVPM